MLVGLPLLAFRCRFLAEIHLVFLLALQWTQQREENDITDRAGIGQQHCQAIDANAFACSRGQSIGQRPDVVLIHLVSFFVATGAFAQLLFEAVALLLGIVELAEGVTDLQTADKDLEALHPVGVLFRLALVLGEGRDGEREVIDKRRLDEVRLGDELKDVCDRLAVGRSRIVWDVRVGRVVTVHHRGDLLRTGEVAHLRLGARILGPKAE